MFVQNFFLCIIISTAFSLEYVNTGFELFSISGDAATHSIGGIIHRKSISLINLYSIDEFHEEGSFLMSKANHLIHSNTNFSAMSVVYSRKKLKQTIIFNGYNSKNIFIASILWYLKSLLPYNFGGFENKIKTTSKLEAL